MQGHTGEAYGLISDAYFDTTRRVGLVFITNGCGKGYTTSSTSAFYTVEEEIFNAIESYGNLDNCLTVNITTTGKPESKLSISQNPAKNNIEITKTDSFKPTLLRLFSIDGRLIQETIISSKKTSLNISKLKQGIYLLKLDNTVEKLIKE